LDPEGPSRPARAAERSERRPGTDPHYEPGEPALGCAAASRRRGRGADSSRITSRPWHPSTSSPSLPFASRSCKCSWCWRTSAAGFSTLGSRPTPPPNGPPNNSAMPFRGIRRHAICCVTGIGSSVTTSQGRLGTWASGKCSRHLGHPGSALTRNA
jgi:hypothetical protein